MKLGYLAVKQVSKPLANLIKLKAKTTPFLRNRLLLPPAQCKLEHNKYKNIQWSISFAVYHKVDTTIKMKLLGLGKVVNVKPLTEDQAVDLSAEMLGEFIIFGIAAVLLLSEYKRSQYKDAYKAFVLHLFHSYPKIFH